MQVRETIQKYKTVVVILAIVVLLGAILKITLFNGKGTLQAGPTSSTVLFYDLATGKLESRADNLTALENIAANPAVGLVRAYAYSCSGCKDKNEYTIGYLETFTPEAIDNLKSAGLQTYTLMDAEPSSQVASLIGPAGRLVKAPSDNAWQLWNSSSAQNLRMGSTRFTCSDHKSPQLCSN